MTFARRSLFPAAAALLFLSCASEDYMRLYHADAKPAAYGEDDIKNLKYLGPTLLPKGVNFGVYSENATRMELLIFEKDVVETNRPTKTFEMTRFGDVWNVFVEGVGVGLHYGYRAWGPNWPYDPAWYPGSVIGFKADVDKDGNRFNPNKLLSDPYAKAIDRDHDWSKGSTASGPKRADVTYAASSKSLVVESKYVWSDSEAGWAQKRQQDDFPGHNWNEQIVYEVHVKGFTASPASGVKHPGTYRGVGEKADYFKDLGITTVELMPVMEKPSDGGYWGYQTLNFFAPENTYASKRDTAEAIIDEFKWMVDELHRRNIEVVLDVVYNHTGEGGLWREKIEPSAGGAFDLYNFDPKEVAGIYSYRGLDNQAYYALSPDKQTYWNNTGVGNETRCNHRPMRKLIMDSLRYWVEEMHVDGFRFDLAPILGEKDLDYNVWEGDKKTTVLQDIADEPLFAKKNIRLVAEPWSLSGAWVGGFPSSSTSPKMGWGEWNGRFRDWWRAFFNNDDWKLNSQEGGGDGGFLMTGSSKWYQWNGRKPWHSQNFVTVHDGFTMYDVFSYNQKQNKCGPLNPICCEQPFSSWCDRNSGEDNNRSRDWGDELRKRQQMRNLFVAMLVSHGTPLLLGGDEWMRTQLGNNNAYSTRADNEFNWFDWGIWQANEDRIRMHDFVSKVVQFRKAHYYAFAPVDYGAGAPFSWKSPDNTDTPNWGGKSLMVHYHDASKGPELLVLVNGETAWKDFKLPTGRQWRRVIDTQQEFDKPAYLADHGLPATSSYNVLLDNPDVVTTAVYGVPDHTIVVLEAK